MTLPRLRAEPGDDRAVARILRGALRHEVEYVPLAWPPTSGGQHLLEVEVAGEGLVTLLADPAGLATADGHPLHVRPVTRPQMAALLAMVERLDEPSRTVPPPSTPWSSDGSAETGEATLIDQLAVPPAPRAFGAGPPSSGVERERTSRAPRGMSLPPIASIPVPRSVPEDLLVGRVIAGKYKLESAVGSGSTAAVFRALHLDLQRDVAVKILHEQKLGQMQFVKRFKGEALSASKLEHPNVTRVIDFGQEKDGLLYLVMELLAGRSLEAILAVEGRLPEHKAVAIAIQACSAIAFAHDVGIVHRDVKPENIMIVPHRDDDGNPSDLVKVCDFGLAKLHDPAPDQEELTTSGMLCGSPSYMSPEQARGEKIDGRTDIYSLGVTLFEALTGTLPHEATSLAELFTKKMFDSPRKLSQIVPGIDPLLEDVVLRALSIDPAGRHPNARMLREELREVAATLLSSEDERDSTIVAD
jgi:serine/threonine-protein kinase